MDYRTGEPDEWDAPARPGGVAGALTNVAYALVALIAAAVTATLEGGHRVGWPRLLPADAQLEREWGNLALLLGVAGAIVATYLFVKTTRAHVLHVSVVSGLVTIALAVPFMAARHGVNFGLPAPWFSVLMGAAYLLLHGAVGMLVSGGVVAIAAMGSRN